MEDEDGESKVMDMWNALGDQQLKDTMLGNSLKHPSDSVYNDVIEDGNQIIQYNSVTGKESPGKNSNTGSKIVFKGFKKRILAQAQETQVVAPRNSMQEQQVTNSNVSPKSKDKRSEKRGKITEYAQYLGLQPSSRPKCSKCHPPTSVSSTLKPAPCTCNSTMAPMPSTSESSSVPHPANFKITRKVYLCAACGTYFENWNLFLHMRDIHKRHICLFCLGMFGQAERLLHHLSKKHSVPEMAFASVEDFYNTFKGSCYLVCCTCEKVFSETDNFYNHFCSPPLKQETNTSVCTLCRQVGSHANNCTLAIETSKTPTVPLLTTTMPNAVSAPTPEIPLKPGNKGVMRKVTKNNRTKHREDGMMIPNHQQHSNVNVKKAKQVVPQFNENHVHPIATRDDGTQIDIVNNTGRDTVSETIMEVSRYVGDSCDEADDKNMKDSTPDKVSGIMPSAQDTTYNEPYDSVTQTIMEVSRCTSDVEDEESSSKRQSPVCTEASDLMDKTDLEEDACKDVPSSGSAREVDGKVNESSPVHQEPEETEVEEKAETDDKSQIIESPEHSPISRSLFSPQHDSVMLDLQSKQVCSEQNDEREEKTVSTAESQTSVSFNTVAASSDRSLVIKICTNKNSQFSVSSAIPNNNIESYNTSKESEENNNAERLTPDSKHSNSSEKERDSIGSYHLNDGDSDSDSDKLAVVDNIPEESQEPEELEETNVQDKIELSTDTATETNVHGNEQDKLIDQITNQEPHNPEAVNMTNNETNDNKCVQQPPSDGIILAGEDVPCIDLNVEGTLDSLDIEDLLKRCIEAASPFCVYCNHARHIAVNGKQLGLHMLAEHKFQPQHPAIIIHAEQFVIRVKKSLEELEFQYFNLNSYSSANGTYNVPNVRTYECFHCRFHSAVHKELYLHNRKMHQKTILICIMCKSTFYSYSELLCHLCPGIYSPNINVRYRCCLCPVASLPSAFRLMVHLRKRHHACDVCLESTGNQQRLSNHVWKHKLHHLCYRCGIAYRNKPDITKHLFWKHGTESVLCKKCLQKKWPHIYHFCIPPTAFVCEECGSNFSRAVALKVHKRLHSGDQPYACNECSERFISQKLLAKHMNTHKEPPAVDVNVSATVNHQPTVVDETSEKDKILAVENTTAISETVKESKEPVKKVVDVYDLPPLNLSSESDTDSEDEKGDTKDSENAQPRKPSEQNTDTVSTNLETSAPSSPVNDSIVEVEQNEEEKKQEAKIMDGIWDNFKTYTASLEMKESGNNISAKESEPECDIAFLRSVVLADHDYCVVWSDKDKSEKMKEEMEGNDVNERDSKLQRSSSTGSVVQNMGEGENKKKLKTPKKKKQSGSTSSSDSSSDSDSSSCSCGTNCSCSSSSSGSSSSSSSSSDSDSSASESSPRKSSRKDRKKEKDNIQENTLAQESENKDTSIQVENGMMAPCKPASSPKPLLRESDLETDETETDEDFYDEHPQQLANQLLAEKRNQLLLLAAVAPATESSVSLNNGITDDSIVPSPDPANMTTGMEGQPPQKKKVKTKKRKKGERGGKQRNATPAVESIKLNIPKAYYQKNSAFSASLPPAMTLQPNRSLTPNMIPTNEVHPGSTIEPQPSVMMNQNLGSGSETENKRSSKRKRIPKRFYGDSSDEETEKQSVMKWRKVEPPPFVSTPTIKTIPPRLPFGGKTMPAYRPPVVDSQPSENLTVATASATESEPAESSSDSSDSEVETAQTQVTVNLPAANAPNSERPVNLYCYCQCPYDEVSEMIACDGEDCRIEWFHFECVGIMVPPKGKWYCPDCRKKHGIVQNNEDYFD